MNKTINAIALAAGILSLAGCSSTPTKVDTGAVKARTFSFVKTDGKPVPNYASNEQQTHLRVQAAIKESLARRNVTHVEQGGDLTVGYLIILGNGVATTMINDHFGYGRDAAKLLDKAHGKYTSTGNPNSFEAGTLLIDLIESKSWKVVHRGYVTRELHRNLTAEQRDTRIREGVEEIMKEVDFK